MPLLTRWLPASAAPYMEVALALPDIGRWYVFFLNSYSRLEWSESHGGLVSAPRAGAAGPGPGARAGGPRADWDSESESN